MARMDDERSKLMQSSDRLAGLTLRPTNHCQASAVQLDSATPSCATRHVARVLVSAFAPPQLINLRRLLLSLLPFRCSALGLSPLLPPRRPLISLGSLCRLPLRSSPSQEEPEVKGSSIRAGKGDGVRADHIAAAPHLDHHHRHCPLHLLSLAESETATAKMFGPCSL